MISHIRFWYLLLGLIIGIVGVLIIKPSQTIVYKFPNPENAGKITYKDKNEICYTYKATEVDCDKNEARLKDYPLNN